MPTGGVHNSFRGLYESGDQNQIHDRGNDAKGVPDRRRSDAVQHHHVGRGSRTHHPHRRIVWFAEDGKAPEPTYCLVY